MSKKVLTVNIETGKKVLETVIDDTIATGSEEITYSGKFVDEQILSVTHESHILGGKSLDDENIDDKYVVTYNETEDKLEYKSVENLLEVIDCGTF